MSSFLNQLSPWFTLCGVFTLLAGLGWDAILHRRNPDLAAQEGIFTFSNPSHLLFALGIALIIGGALSFLFSRASDARASFAPRLFAVGMMLALFLCSGSSFVLALTSEGSVMRGHTHQNTADATTVHEDDQHQHDAIFDPTHGHVGPHKHTHDGPHIKATAPRTPTAADQQRAAETLKLTRAATAKYKDVRVAEKDGYKAFLPNLPQAEYHYTNWSYAVQAAFRFDPAKPSSLLYKKVNGELKLVGVMYTASARASEDELNRRFPTSIAPWHLHVNICAPPKGQERLSIGPTARFGPNGSIASETECDAANGKFYPSLFGWMLHLYPFEE